MTSVSTASQQGTGNPTVQRERPHKVNDKYKGCSNCVEGKSKTDCSIKHSLKRHCKKWEDIGAFQYILKVIYSGYEIPFVSIPPPMLVRNNKSATNNADFVTSEISQLSKTGCVVEVTHRPYIVSPLSVAENRSKKRLILDLSRLNNYVKYEKIKFEDWKTAMDYFEKDCYCLKFDLKSGYHHIDISESFQKYLGFSWNDKYYCYTVLPFGLSSAPFIFTKCLRPIVKFWRKRGIKIVLYLDDGFVFAPSKHECLSVSEFIQNSLSEFGLLINFDKSIFYPTQNLEWLGILWDSKSFSISVPTRRIDDTIGLLQKLVKSFPRVTARELARAVGKIISMSPIMGNICSIMTRFSSIEIASRKSWDDIIVFTHKNEVLNECNFWLQCIYSEKTRYLKTPTKKSVIVYSDASSLASGAYTVEVDSKCFHLMWKESEKSMSSTWRELRAIELALASFKDSLVNKDVKWFTDNQSCVKIVQSGSMKHHLQSLAYNIFKMCVEQKISIDIQWIPRLENEKADFLSNIIDHDDWGVTVKFFEFINNLFGNFTVDRFANYNNCKLGRYNSKFWNPGSEAIDCFTQNWENENNWLVPPVNLVVRTIRHLIACKAFGVLIVPNWPSAVFWPFIFDKDMIYRWYVKDVLLFHECTDILIQGNNKTCLFGTKEFTSGILAVKLDARS